MRRLDNAFVRPGWERRILEGGLVYSPTRHPDGTIAHYWREGGRYEFTEADITTLVDASTELFSMGIVAADWMIERPSFMRDRMLIPDWTQRQVVKTWNREPPDQSVYARFDLAFGGLDHPDPAMRTPRLYELNGDTPTALVESGRTQWDWMHETGFGTAQFNELYERLINAWARNLALLTIRLGHKPVVHFACSNGEPTGEDVMNTIYLQAACEEAGYKTRQIYMENIVLGTDGRFYDDHTGQHIDVIFKLHPWEWIVQQEFGHAAFLDMENTGGTVWIEPPYKMLWNNKALAVVLWKLFGDDPVRSRYLIPSYFEDERPETMIDYVRKPLLGREGAGVQIVRNNEPDRVAPSPYDNGPFIVQAYTPPPMFYVGSDETRVHAVVGSWIIDGGAGGICVRESPGPVTDENSFFVPHIITEH